MSQIFFIAEKHFLTLADISIVKTQRKIHHYHEDTFLLYLRWEGQASEILFQSAAEIPPCPDT